MIIGISGKSKSGKDTADDFVVAKHGFVKIAFADELKRICMRLWDFSEEQLWGDLKEEPDKRYPLAHTPPGVGYNCGRRGCKGNYTDEGVCTYLTPRHVFQQLGTEVARGIDPDVWVRFTMKVANRLLTEDLCYIRTIGLVMNQEWEGYSDTLRKNYKRKPRARGVLITDCRFRNEFDAIKQADGKTVRIKRGQLKFGENVGENGEDCVVVQDLTDEQKKHASETEQEEIPDGDFDYIIPNTGGLPFLEDLTLRMMDVFNGNIRPYDEAQADIPPALRR